MRKMFYISLSYGASACVQVMASPNVLYYAQFIICLTNGYQECMCTQTCIYTNFNYLCLLVNVGKLKKTLWSLQ